MRIIGLTGGIATGKSTVADYLANQYHLPILDADLYAREAIAPPSTILDRVFERYGTEIQDPSGELNRKALGDIIFSDSAEKQWLEAKIHPYVRQRFEDVLREHAQKAQNERGFSLPVVCAIPLLFEVGLTHLVTEIWVVTCQPEQQLARLCHRNQLNLEQAQARIAAQLPLPEKVAQADVILDNSLDIATLHYQIDRAINGSCYNG